MANLGILEVSDLSTLGKARAIPTWFLDPLDPLHTDVDGQIDVTVKVQGVIQAGVFCQCIYRDGTFVVGAGKTDTKGKITFKDLNRESSDYYVIAFSEDDYSAMIFDKLTPT